MNTPHPRLDAVWHVSVARSDLMMAINAARYRPSRKRFTGLVKTDVVLAPCEAGLSVRTHNRGADIASTGKWASPIAVNGAWLKRLVPVLAGERIELTFADGQLALNGTRLTAREV